MTRLLSSAKEKDSMDRAKKFIPERIRMLHNSLKS